MKEILDLIKDPKNKAIALLGVALIVATAMNFRDKAVKEVKSEVKEQLVEIQEDDKEDEVDFAKAMKDIESNDDQIKALWGAIRELENDFKDHEDKKKH